jgi:hypothetical protein
MEVLSNVEIESPPLVLSCTSTTACTKKNPEYQKRNSFYSNNNWRPALQDTYSILQLISLINDSKIFTDTPQTRLTQQLKYHTAILHYIHLII